MEVSFPRDIMIRSVRSSLRKRNHMRHLGNRGAWPYLIRASWAHWVSLRGHIDGDIPTGFSVVYILVHTVYPKPYKYILYHFGWNNILTSVKNVDHIKCFQKLFRKKAALIQNMFNEHCSWDMYFKQLTSWLCPVTSWRCRLRRIFLSSLAVSSRAPSAYWRQKWILWKLNFTSITSIKRIFHLAACTANLSSSRINSGSLCVSCPY